jgi:hypothetical protein
MKQKHKIYILLVISLLSVVGSVGVMLYASNGSSVCDHREGNIYTFVDTDCYDYWNSYDQKAEPILISFSLLLFISLVLLFVRREAFIAWAKFAGVAFPLMLGTLLYTFTHESESAAWMSGPSNAQMAMTILPFLFIITSFVIIAFNQAKR